MTRRPGSAEVERFRGVVAQQLGLRFDDSRLPELADVLRLRMEATDYADIDSYLYSLAGSRQEMYELARHLTVPETYFFRIADHFRAFSDVVLPERINANTREFAVLSAGCASGEEAYTVAMLLRDAVDLRRCRVSITAVDVNPAVIALAKAGRYSDWSLRDTPGAVQQRYFRRHGRSFELDSSVRDMVTFVKGNLADARAPFWKPAAYDVIFFRNVMMYFAPDAARHAIARMAQSLKPGGYLFLGPAETLRGISHGFHLCHTHDTFYYRRSSNGSARRASMMDQIAALPAPFAVPPAAEPHNGWRHDIQVASERIADLTRDARPSRRLQPAASKPPAPPRSASPGVIAALDLLRDERFAEALAALQSMAETDRNVDALLLRAVLLANTGNAAEAERVCARLLLLDDLNAGAHYVTALCLETAGDLAGAADRDKTAIYLDPSFAMPHLHLGLLAKRSGDRESARQELNQAALLLAREDAARILLFGGGFSRESLVELCRRELRSCGGDS